MERVLRERDRLRPGRLDLLLTVTTLLLVGLTALLLVDPSLDLVIFDRTLDVAVNSLTVLAFAGLAALSLTRYRESGRLSGLFQASAMTLLAAVGAANVLLVVLKLDGRLGLTLGLPEQFPIYVLSISRLVAAVLLALGAVAAVRGVHARPVTARRLVAGPPIVILLGAVVLFPLRELLPPLIGVEGMRGLIAERPAPAPLPGLTGDYLGLIGITVLLLAGAAIAYRFAYARRGPVIEGFFAVGLLVAAFAELHAALYPAVYTGLVSSADVLRLVFSLVLLVGIDAEARADLRALRRAYASLDRLRANEAERAALEERARLAREIHDGLAQHLWFAKLKHERLLPAVPDTARPLASEVGQALDAAIVEARQALVTMRQAVEHELSLAELIQRTVDDFGQRSGLRVEFVAEDLPARIPARQQAELLRVVQEALTNVRKHADATMVRVRAAQDGGELVITVSDNGRGFDPEATVSEGLGLVGMEERARLMGGELGIASAPSDGTSVSVRLPLTPAASGPA